MPYSHTIVTPQQAHIAIWHLDESLDELMAIWNSPAYPSSFYNASSEKRRREILATALLMRQHFGRDITLDHAANGAPLIEEGFISISHTATHVVIATHSSRAIGVDIETIGTKAVRVMERFLSPEEISELPCEQHTLPCGTSYRCAAIHMAWSIKESIYKIHPQAVEFRRDIILSPITTLPDGATKARLSKENNMVEAHYTLYDGCSLAWALR